MSYVNLCACGVTMPVFTYGTDHTCSCGLRWAYEEGVTPTPESVKKCIDALKTENDRLRKALEPLAKYANHIESWPDAASVICINYGNDITAGDCRKARAALKGGK
jgi:hypothetical protein